MVSIYKNAEYSQEVALWFLYGGKNYFQFSIILKKYSKNTSENNLEGKRII